MRYKPLRFLILLAVLFVYWRWLLPYPHVASDLHVTIQSELRNQLTLPTLWGSEGAVGMGENSTYVIWNWPIEAFFGLFGNLGFSHSFVNQFFALFIGMLVGFYGVTRMLKRYKLTPAAKYIAALFYLTNSYILLLVDGGQLAIALAYFYMPLVYSLTVEAAEEGYSKKILAAFSMTLIGIFDIRFIYILALLVGATALYKVVVVAKAERLEIFFRWLKLGIFVGLLTLLLNAYWILPALISRGQALPATYARTSQTSFLDFTTLGHSLFLQQPHWYKNVFGRVTELNAVFLLIPLLVFTAPIFKRRDKTVGFWLLSALTGVFLAKGANPPFPGVYTWLFTNVPGFSLFRDSTKFFFLVALSYTVLIGITVEGLTKLFKWRVKFGKLKIALIPVLLATYFVLLVRSVWLGKMTGTFSPPVYQEEFEEINKIIGNDDSFGRVFWIPTKAPLGYSSILHPSVEASRFVQKRPFAIGTVGSYEIFNYLREAPFMGELFGIAGIKYVAYPYSDTRRDELKQDNIDYYYAFLDQLTNLPWIERRLTDPPVPLLKVKNSQNHFFVSENTFLVVGSDGIYNELIGVEGFSLSNNALIFAEEKPGVSAFCKDTPCRYLLYDKDEIDLAATFIDQSNLIFPAQQLDFEPNETSWWMRETPDFLWWRNFLQQKYGIDNQDFDYGGGWAIAEGNKQLTISSEQITEGNILLARVMESSKAGRVEFFQGEQKVGEVVTKLSEPEKVDIRLTGYREIPDQIFTYDKADFRWSEVGKLTDYKPLTIKTEGDINVVNSLVSINEDEWSRLRSLVYGDGTTDCINNCPDGSNHQDRNLRWEELTEEDKEIFFTKKGKMEVSYERVNSTHYKVNVSGVSKPITLAFSETYDPLWEITNRKTGEKGASYPLYSLINGFYVEKDGEYDIHFSPQKYVYPGLVISATTFLVVLSALYLLRKKTKD